MARPLNSAPSNPKIFRSDSLYARLKTTENREQVFAWIAEDCLGPEKVAELIRDKFDVTTSAAAVCEMQRRCGLVWRIQRSAALALDQEKELPEDIDNVTRLRLRQQYRDAVFENLTRQELLAFAQHDLQVRRFEADVARTEKELAQKDTALKQKDVALKQKDRSLQQSERRVKLLEFNANQAKEKLKAITKGGKGKGLSAATLKEIEEAAKLL